MNTYSKDTMYESYSGEVERMQKCIDELLQENKQLKIQISAREEVCDRLESNWNKLKKYIKTEIPEDVFINTEWFVSILDKMQELEGSDSNEQNKNK